MMSLIHYISAMRRLKELEKTVTLLKHDKYSESDVPTMVLAQRDFVLHVHGRVFRNCHTSKEPAEPSSLAPLHIYSIFPCNCKW